MGLLKAIACVLPKGKDRYNKEWDATVSRWIDAGFITLHEYAHRDSDTRQSKVDVTEWKKDINSTATFRFIDLMDDFRYKGVINLNSICGIFVTKDFLYSAEEEEEYHVIVSLTNEQLVSSTYTTEEQAEQVMHHTIKRIIEAL